MSINSRTITALLILVVPIGGHAQSPVRAEAVTERLIVSQVSVTGTVTSPRTALLSTAVAGLVAELTTDEGRRVVAGEALLRLDSELAQLAHERALAEVLQRETDLADARRRFAEAEKVGEQRGIARTQIESLRAEVTSDEAALVASRAAAREQQAIVERHTLRAPFAGVISQRITELGEWVNPGNGLLELTATDNLRFDFQVGQNNFASLSPQTAVDISLDAIPGEPIAGRIDTIVPVKSPGARTFLVRVVAENTEPENALKITPGMSVRAQLNVDAGRSGIAISRDAVLRFPDGRITVWVVDTGEDTPVVREQLIRTGFEFSGQVEITSGLAVGDLVVVRGNETLQEGQAVSILDGEL